jgi:subtilisin family serine protease
MKDARDSSNIEFVEPDPVAFAFGQPNDPQASGQWAHRVIESAKAWDIGQGSHSVTVGIVDTGFDYNHPDLKDNIWVNPGEIAGNGRDDDGNGYVDDIYGWDFANNDSNPIADDTPTFHGTHVSGTIGAVGNNGIGVAGHSWKVKLMALKFLGSNGSGDVSGAIKAIDYAIAKRVKILNNSWGSYQGSQALAQAIDRARQAGILFVAAAGNGGQDGVGDNNDQMPNYPANYAIDNIISVAATNSSDLISGFSNFGPRTVHIGAPGEGILSTANGGRYQSLSGTSMATPLVSGVAALMYALKPSSTYLQIKQALLSSVDRIQSLQGKVTSNGRINAYKAMVAIGGNPNPTPTPTPGPTPTPTATPIPTPIPTPTPGQGIANTPLFFGQSTSYVTGNPTLQIMIDYDVRNFPGATSAGFEVSKANVGFSNPNGTAQDANHYSYAFGPTPNGRFGIVPTTNLPGWGTYQLRVIPLDAQRRPVGRFSNSAILTLRP